MPVLQVNDQRYTLKLGQTRLGVGTGVDLDVGGSAGEAAGVYAILDMGANGQVAIRRASAHLVRVNGIALGAEPTPLIHGDKVQIDDRELLYSEDTQFGETQFVSSNDLMQMAQKRSGPARATTATGGRLISLVDGKEYPIAADGVVIGRDAASDVVVAENEVSRRHAQIVPAEQGYVLRDLSTNGVFVNGERLQQPTVLARADVVRVGSEEFRFYADVVAPAARPAPQSLEAPLQESVVAAPPAAAAQLPAAARVPEATPKPASEPATGESAAPSAPAVPEPMRAADTRPVLASLEITNEGVEKGKRYEIRVPLAHVGRGTHNDVVIVDDSVSDTHAKLVAREEGWFVADLGSTNGTYVGGSRLVAERRLDGVTDVRFGGVKLLFRPEGASARKRGTDGVVAGGAGGTRAIASVPVDRAARTREPVSVKPDAAPERRSNGWIWVLILAAAAVAIFLLLNS